MNKRTLLLTLCLGCLPFLRGADFQIETLRLSPRVAVFYGGPWDNGVVAVATQKGLVVVDAPFSKSLGKGFREAIQKEFKRGDFACLINTHEHGCHIGGNEAFADLPILGHDSVRREMLKLMADPKQGEKFAEVGERELAAVRARILKRDPKLLEGSAFIQWEKEWKLIQADLRGNPAPVPPTTTFDHEMTLHEGDVDLRLIHYGRSHGIGDTVVSIPQENLVLTAGIFYPTHVPTLGQVTEESTPAQIDNWFTVMHGLLDRADEHTRFLASHGRAVMRKGQYVQFVAYLEGLWNGVRRAKSGGKTLEQAKAAIQLKDYPEIAKLPNEELRGSEWENLDIHGHNLEHLWKVLEGTSR